MGAPTLLELRSPVSDVSLQTNEKLAMWICKLNKLKDLSLMAKDKKSSTLQCFLWFIFRFFSRKFIRSEQITHQGTSKKKLRLAN
jgi:hypothetical protein